MADNAQKTPLARTLNIFAQKKVLDQIQVLGKALPASVTAVSGSIVTVKFEVTGSYTLPSVTVPMFGPEYIRYPIQVGAKGVVFPADAGLGGISGLGGGIADLSLPANLSALVFFPVASKEWSASESPNSLVLYGPDGVIIRDANNVCSITLTATGVAIKGNVTLTGDLMMSGTMKSPAGATYAGNLTTTGDIIAGVGGVDQVGLRSHRHLGVTTGSGSTAVPTPGT